jgi:hypothetical protein
MKNALRLGLVGLAGMAGSALLATAASADTISAEVSINGGAFIALTNQSLAGPGTYSYSSNGPLYGVTITGTGNPPLTAPNLFGTFTTDFSNNAEPVGTTFNLLITEQGVTTPTPGFLSSLDLLTLTGGLNVTLQTLYSSTNALFSGTVIGSLGPTSAAAGNATVGTAVAGVPGTYSLTEEYSGTLNATNAFIQADENISATPLPAALPLFATGLAGFLAFGRKRKSSPASLNAAVA